MSVLPPSIKADIIRTIDELAAYAIAEEPATNAEKSSCVVTWHSKCSRALTFENLFQTSLASMPQLERIWKEFICDKVMMRGICILKGVEQQERPDFPFHIEFWIDRDMGSYEHTLAFLKLLETIFERHVPFNLDDNRVLDVIDCCIMLLPPLEGQPALFSSACDRWKIYSAVLRVIETAMH
jgi:hypothetical protein